MGRGAAEGIAATAGPGGRVTAGAEAGVAGDPGRGTVSVVMAVYNGQRYLAQQLSSVLQQLGPDDEMVVIDDASTDTSAAMLSALNDARVRVLRNAANLGVVRSFERGLGAVRHEIVFLCDQDDVWLPGKREAVVDAFARHPGCLVVISDAQLIDAHGNVSATSFMSTRDGFRGGFWSTVLRNRYLGCAMALHRPLLKAVLPIPRDVPLHDMWIGALAAALGAVCYLPEPLIQYRRHGGNFSPDRRQPLTRMLRWRWALLSRLVARLLKLRFGLV